MDRAGFSLTEAARLAGVSPAAPYRHFRDRDALLAEVAKSGFERFAARLDMAWNNGVPTPLSAFDNLGKAYLAFARDEPASYAVMFEGGVPPTRRDDPRRRARLRCIAEGRGRALPRAARERASAGQTGELCISGRSLTASPRCSPKAALQARKLPCPKRFSKAPCWSI